MSIYSYYFFTQMTILVNIKYEIKVLLRILYNFPLFSSKVSRLQKKVFFIIFN